VYQELVPASAAAGKSIRHSMCMMEHQEHTTGDEGTERSEASQAQPHDEPPPQTTVLIVDDEAVVRETLIEILSLYGYRTLTAASLEEAEEIKQRLGADAIHLVIADIHLTPEPQARAGYALAQRWRALHPGLPFILISGDSSNQDLPDIRAGALRFLPKPFALDALVGAVREALCR
jgi:DNA-binding NtrC family response regulator